MKYWLKAWQSQAKLHIDIEENVAVVLCVGADTIKPPATHQISRETGLSQSPIDYSAYHIPRSWSEVSEETSWETAEWSQPPCVHHPRFVVAEQPAMTWIQLTTSAAYCSNELPDKSAGCERFEAASDWRCGLEWTMPLHNHWCRRIHACIRARTGHFFIFTVTQITQKVVNCNNCSA